MEKEFQGFGKIARLSREVVITEKIDGTNAQICIGEDGSFLTGSRNRWITPEKDNFGFSRWAHENKDELMRLGPGQHFGEWYGSGIQRGYGLTNGVKRFALFNTYRHAENRPRCCELVPVLFQGLFTVDAVENVLRDLAEKGSQCAPGFMKPEGIVIYHTAAKIYFKKTIEGDESPKGQPQGGET
jgi:hypothetical protein